ncbi:MAG: hypothetical protein ACRD8Z_20965, partial [Nitrososphaeraceae archaeon]
LQVDATVITGELFFLTLTSLLDTMPTGGEARFTTVLLTMAIITPFSESAILVLWKNLSIQSEIRSHLYLKKVGPTIERKGL